MSKLFFVILFFLVMTSEALAAIETDVIVVGAGAGGISAAIQAARMGQNVVLIEETDCIGGQMTCAGVPNMDDTAYSRPRDRHAGIYKEFIDQVINYYARLGKSVGTCYWNDSTYCFEPFVGQKILRSMIERESRITLIERHSVKSVIVSNNTVTGIIIENKDGVKKTVKAPVTIDATEYGDVIMLSGSPYRIANNLSSNVEENACIQDITYTAVVRKYSGGVPADLILDENDKVWLFGDDSAGADAALTTWTNYYNCFFGQEGSSAAGCAYSWRLDGPKPFFAYRGVPDSLGSGDYHASDGTNITKTIINLKNDYPADASFLNDRVKRFNTLCKAKKKTLQQLYYWQNTLGLDWSLAKEEGFDTAYNIEENNCNDIPDRLEKHMPPMAYVRESARIIPIETLKAKDIKRTGTAGIVRNSVNSIAVGDYVTDLHNCGANSDLETYLGETTDDISDAVGPFQVPLGALIPKSINGLIAAEKNIGVTRLANGATRLQPIVMMIGQVAGIVASLSIHQGVNPRDVEVLHVQQQLLNMSIPISSFIYDDTPRNNLYWKATQLLSAHHISNGVQHGTGNVWDAIFGIDKKISRGQAAVLIARSLGFDTNYNGVGTFSDVHFGQPYFGAVEALASRKITVGCSVRPKKYCPEALISRAQLATLIGRAFAYGYAKCTPTNSGPTNTFSDVPNDHWAHAYIYYMVNNGWMKPCSDGKFCPNKSMTRGEVANVLYSVMMRRYNGLSKVPFSDSQCSAVNKYVLNLIDADVDKVRDSKSDPWTDINSKKIYVDRHSFSLRGSTKNLYNGMVKLRYKNRTVDKAEIRKNGKWRLNAKVKKDGKFRYEVRFYDVQGNRIKKKRYTVIVDTEDPVFIDLPRRLHKKPGDKIWWDAKDDIRIKHYRYQIDNGRKVKTKKKFFTIPLGINRGKHILRVWAHDRAGNKMQRDVHLIVY